MPASSMEASNLPVGPLYANPTSFVAVKSSSLHPKRKVAEMSLKQSLFDHFFMFMHQLPFRRRSFTVQMHHQIPINPQIVLERPHPHFSFNLPKHSHLRRFSRSSFSHKSFYPPYDFRCKSLICRSLTFKCLLVTQLLIIPLQREVITPTVTELN